MWELGVGRARESNEGKMGTTVIEQKILKKKYPIDNQKKRYCVNVNWQYQDNFIMCFALIAIHILQTRVNKLISMTSA